jgi:STE24 endopeptidase
MIFYIIISIIILDFILDQVLDYLNIRHWSPQVPEEVSDVYQQDNYLKAREYSLTNYRFSVITAWFSFILIMAMLLTGGFGWLDDKLRAITIHPFLLALLFFTVLGFASDILTLQFSLYKIFVIEEKFGFNKMTVKTFITDKLKGYILAVIVGGTVLFVLVKILELTGSNFWWLAWLTIVGIMLLTTIFYTSWILPIFNKLTPLPEGELRNAIQDYSRKNSFPLNDIFVMDGSKRSSKANAFFSGLGKKKKIVLYDTLIKNHSVEELVAVLAHETGHYKLKHTRTGLFLGILQTGMMLFIFSLLQENDSLSLALGSTQSSFHLQLLAFSLLYSPVAEIAGIITHIFSRKHEYEADEFASHTFSCNALIGALKKLSADNLSNLTPHPAYVFVHYSHPSLIQRIRMMNKNNKPAV